MRCFCIKFLKKNILISISGDDSIGLPPMDPLTLDTIHIMQGADSPLNIDFTLTNNKLYGLSKSIVTSVQYV